MEKWAGKVAVVTGASVGIGANTAKSLAEKGVIVVGLARREEKIKEISANCDGTIHAVKCDISKEADILGAFHWIEQNLGGVDILINNAGVLSPSSLIDGETDDWKKMIGLNVIGLSICTREALKTMRQRGDDGHIIHINSITGHVVPQHSGLHFGHYSASKFAVTALAEALAFELNEVTSNIKVTSISPGPVYTDMVKDISKKMNIDPPDEAPPGFLDTQDVVDAIIFALSAKPGVQVKELIIQAVSKPQVA